MAQRTNDPMDEVLKYRDSTRQQAKASILIEGLTGKGKSGLALLLAKAFAKDLQKVYAVDTENKSLDLFEGIRFSDGTLCTPFKKVDLLSNLGYSPTKYLKCKENAIASGGLAFIADSITHMWQREGGVLDLVEAVKKASTNSNQWAAWGDPNIVKEKQAIYNTVRDSRIHVICTVRVKEKHEMVTNSDGSKTLQSLGEQELQMPDLKYEPDLVLRMVKAGNTRGDAPIAMVIKSRYVILEEGIEYSFTDPLIASIVEYLEQGTDPAELLERQRQDYIATITGVLDKDVGKKTLFPVLKEQQGFKDTKLTDLPLDVLQTLLGIMLA